MRRSASPPGARKYLLISSKASPFALPCNAILSIVVSAMLVSRFTSFPHYAGSARDVRVRYRMALLLFCLAAAMVPPYGHAQSNEPRSGSRFDKAKVYLQNDTRLEALDLVMHADQVTFRHSNSQQHTSYALSDVQLIKVADGTRFRAYALFGAGFGAAASLLTVLQFEQSNTYESEDINEGGFIVGFTAATAVIGGLIGSTKSKWRTLYVNEGGRAGLLSFKPVFTLGPSQMGVHLTLIL